MRQRTGYGRRHGPRRRRGSKKARDRKARELSYGQRRVMRYGDRAMVDGALVDRKDMEPGAGAGGEGGGQ